MNIIYKSGGMFKIDITQIPAASNTTAVKNGLYAAVYEEFVGAINNPKYNKMTTLQRFNALNAFAQQWLEDRGLL